MLTRETTYSELDRLQPTAIEAQDPLHMDQDTFRSLYERTARPLWAFLWRKTGDRQLADDLLQETYYRFLRARANFDNDAHCRNYLFRIATNLANDTHRHRKTHPVSLCNDDQNSVQCSDDVAGHSQQRRDLSRALSQLSPRQRDALWLAYVEGSSHEEIAGILGLKVGSIKLLLFRARQKMIGLLRGPRS